MTGILIIANITRLVYWLGDHFQTYLLVQSVLMVIFQYGLLYVCVLYRPENWRDSLRPRPLDFWQWARFGTFLEATAILVVAHAVLFFLLHKVDAYVQLLGFLALGLEATLPIPQVLANYRAKSTAGFRLSVLASWAIGDAVKTVYFFLTPNNPLQFKVCGIFQLSVRSPPRRSGPPVSQERPDAQDPTTAYWNRSTSSSASKPSGTATKPPGNSPLGTPKPSPARQPPWNQKKKMEPSPSCRNLLRRRKRLRWRKALGCRGRCRRRRSGTTRSRSSRREGDVV